MLDVSEIQTIDHDVMVIGAGGAGLRAAIECSALKLNTGVLSKSLLGKAHTVMAEGGMAAAMGNVDSRDNWKVHFRDTMRGGKFLNVWRMAELHAQAGARPGPRARGVGRGVRPHQGRPDLAAQLRRPSLSAARPRRRSHRPGADPLAAGSRRPPGHRLPHGVHRARAAQGRRPRSPACSRTGARPAGSWCSAARR